MNMPQNSSQRRTRWSKALWLLPLTMSILTIAQSAEAKDEQPQPKKEQVQLKEVHDLDRDHLQALPSHFDADTSMKFSETKWTELTDQGIKALNEKKFSSAEQFFQAAVREATKAPCMSTYMVDSLVHTAEVYRQTDRKQDAKDNYDQAFDMVKMLVAEKCPMCESNKESIPVIYGPHSADLEEWVKSKAVQLGDFKAVTNKRKQRPLWYCKMCEKAY